jgi:hypothetical protein
MRLLRKCHVLYIYAPVVSELAHDGDRFIEILFRYQLVHELLGAPYQNLVRKEQGIPTEGCTDCFHRDNSFLLFTAHELEEIEMRKLRLYAMDFADRTADTYHFACDLHGAT